MYWKLFQAHATNTIKSTFQGTVLSPTMFLLYNYNVGDI